MLVPICSHYPQVYANLMHFGSANLCSVDAGPLIGLRFNQLQLRVYVRDSIPFEFTSSLPVCRSLWADPRRKE